ncbi:MAG: sulfotransferase family 2 domain-containing protein [Verrucomicrobiales bacterium]|nr:sulfotransferase family 2 domain-containing protein [Verrucomicrobiales bacterium]
MWHRFRRWNFRTFRPAKFAGLQKKRGPFDEHRCIFVHIPKCAGISVVKSLFGDFDCGHASLRRYQIMFGPEEFSRYFKFTIVRNPFDRLVSAFLFMKQGGLHEKDRRWADRKFSRFDTFDAFVKGWVNTHNVVRALHFRPQSHFICLAKNRPGLDFTGYFENLEADFAFICRKLHFNVPLLEANRNPARKKNYQEYYTDESRRIVAEVYADDLRILGYNFDNSNLKELLAMRDAGGRPPPSRTAMA